MAPPFHPRGLLIAAPASGSGKTTVTLALLRHFRNAGRAVGSCKVGPDYIDPAFHTRASGRPCLNLDAWAMRPETLADCLRSAGDGAELIVGEGVMGLYDGAAGTDASTAEVSRLTGWPVVLVVDASRMAASVAPLVHGFATFRGDVPLAAVLLNRVGSPAHERLLREALAPLDIPVLGALPRAPELALPDRHLGLVQAGEHGDLEHFLDRAATWVSEHVNLAALEAIARPARVEAAPTRPALPPLGAHIAVARDVAFAFSYESVIAGWRDAGAAVSTFSPLADEAPCARADAVYLPGGYPELHAGRIAANGRFMEGLQSAASRGAWVYGECGGFMVLGETLVDGDGEAHAMAGLLPVRTSFAQPKMTLGYREAVVLGDWPLGPARSTFRGHEFHFACKVSETHGAALLGIANARGEALGETGSRVGRVLGSFMHLIDRV